MSWCCLAQVIPTHSSCSSFFMPRMASSLLSSFLPSVACDIRSRLPSCAAVFRPVQCGLRYVRRTSVLHGAVCAAFFLSARGGMRGGLPFRLVRHTRRCSVLSGAARYARRCCGSIKGGPGSLCWNCFSSLRCGAPTEATPQQQWRQQRHGEQRDGNDDGKGILVTTAWHSSIAVSFALFLLYSYTLLHSIE